MSSHIPPNLEPHVITTPRDPNTKHNFGPASDRDSILFTSERPGGDPGSPSTKISNETVDEWISFMKEKGITHILILLDDNELECYEDPGLVKRYEDKGFVVHRCPMGEEGASRRVYEAVEGMEKGGGGCAVAHCTHGMGRSGRVAAGWILFRYGLSPEDATSEALEVARKYGMERLGDAKKLGKWIGSLLAK